MNEKESIMNKCFVCNKKTNKENSEINPRVNLPVCKECKGTDAEKKAEQDALDSLSEDFVCGCI